MRSISTSEIDNGCLCGQSRDHVRCIHPFSVGGLGQGVRRPHLAVHLDVRPSLNRVRTSPLGRDRIWPNLIWPSLFGRIWPNRIWPVPHLARSNWPHLAILIWPNLANFWLTEFGQTAFGQFFVFGGGPEWGPLGSWVLPSHSEVTNLGKPQQNDLIGLTSASAGPFGLSGPDGNP